MDPLFRNVVNFRYSWQRLMKKLEDSTRNRDILVEFTIRLTDVILKKLIGTQIKEKLLFLFSLDT